MNIARQEYHLSERFEVAFNQIHDSLKSILKVKEDRFKVLLDIGARKHKMIGKFYNELKQYAKLRNSLVHDKRELGYYIAEPHIDVVERIEKISNVFTKPNYALTIATKEVIVFDYEDNMLETIQAIKKHGYSQYPIYRNNQCVGLLKTVDIVSWFSKNVIHTMVDLSNIKVKDIISDVQSHPLEIAPKSIDIFLVEDLYEKRHKEKVKLEAVIITESGKNNEKPLGLVTAWDLIEIDYTAD